jgi:hypothetical protein
MLMKRHFMDMDEGDGIKLDMESLEEQHTGGTLSTVHLLLHC